MASLFDDSSFNQRLFFPRSDVTPCPSAATDLTLPVAEGVALHARWHPAPSSRATVVVFHGNGEIVSDYDQFAARYHGEVGADLIAVDFRGYGRSQGVPNYRACIADSHAVIRELRSALGERLRAPLIVLGRSLGGACAAELGGQVPPLVDGIVMESAAADPRGIIARRGLTPASSLSAEETRVFDPRPKLARCQLPVLVLHGSRDKTISPAEARENFRMLTHPESRLVLIKRRGHGDVINDETYFAALREFVGSVRGEQRAQGSRATRGSQARRPAAARALSALPELAEELLRELGRAVHPSSRRLASWLRQTVTLVLRARRERNHPEG